MPTFAGVDYLRIDSLFSEQELLVRQTARQFVDERALPLMRDCFRDARFPRELIPEMGRLGFFGANLEGYGCLGLNNVEYGLIMQELERADSGLRSFASVQGALVMYPILTYGSEEQKQRWLPRLAKRRGHRLLRPDRAGLRVESGGHAEPGAARGLRVDSRRRENLDHQRLRSPTSRWCGLARRTESADSWWSAARPDSARTRFTGSSPCGLR